MISSYEKFICKCNKDAKPIEIFVNIWLCQRFGLSLHTIVLKETEPGSSITHTYTASNT